MAKGAPLPIFIFSLVVFLVLGGFLGRVLGPELRDQKDRLERIEQKLADIEASISLLHFSAEVKGQPLDAILSHLEFWAKKREKSRPSIVDQQIIDEKIDRGVQALRKIGPTGALAVQAAFFLPENRNKQEFRQILLEVMPHLDRDKALKLADKVLRDPGFNSNLRSVAARTLLEIDKRAAGRALAAIIKRETHRGVRNPDPRFQKYSSGGYPDFHNLIHYYIESDHDAKTETLLLVLGTYGHNAATYNAIIRGLETMKNKRVVPYFKRYFASGLGDLGNPLVRRNLARAIVTISGSAACEWLKKSLTTERDRGMQAFLSTLYSANCR